MQIALPATLAFAFVAFAVLITVMLWRLARAAIRLLLTVSGDGTISAPALMICLALIALLFPSLVVASWTFFAGLVSAILIEVPRLFGVFVNSFSGCGDSVDVGCVRDALRFLSLPIGEFGKVLLLRTQLDQFPIVDLLLAGGLIAILLSLARRLTDGTGVSGKAVAFGSAVRQSLISMPSELRHTIALALLISFAAFLSISAIASVSLLRQIPLDPDLTKDKLAEQLTKAELKDDKASSAFSAVFPRKSPRCPISTK